MRALANLVDVGTAKFSGALNLRMSRAIIEGDRKMFSSATTANLHVSHLRRSNNRLPRIANLFEDAASAT
jgi:hypothetical protein